MNLLDLTTSAAVRAALGIAEESGELNDSVLEDLELDRMLLADLRGWLPVPMSQILTDPEVDDPGTDAELRLILLRSYATYWCAHALLLSGEISFALRHEDGQNKMVRRSFDQDAMLERFAARAALYKTQLLDLLEQIPSAPAWFAGAAKPVFDPVTQ